MQWSREEGSGSGTSCSRRLPASSAPTHPVLRLIAQLDFLAQAPGDLHCCRPRAATEVLSAGRAGVGAGPEGAGWGRGLLALGPVRADVRTRSSARLQLRARLLSFRNGSRAGLRGVGRSGRRELGELWARLRAPTSLLPFDSKEGTWPGMIIVERRAFPGQPPCVAHAWCLDPSFRPRQKGGEVSWLLGLRANSLREILR